MKTKPSISCFAGLACFLTFLPILTPSAAADHGDTISKAHAITGSEESASLHAPSDVDWFKITLKQAGMTWIYANGSVDTWGELFDFAGNRITFKDSGGAGYNFLIKRKLQPGTYFLRVLAGRSGLRTGDYSLSIRTQETATVWSTPNLKASLSHFGEHDFYRLNVKTAGVTWIYTTGATDTWANLYDFAGNLIIFDDSGGSGYNFRIKRKLSPGTYFLLVKSGSSGHLTGDYTLSIRSQENAIDLRKDTKASFDVYGDLDFYRLNVPMAGPVIVHTTGTTDTWGSLWSDAGNRIMFKDSGWVSDNFLIKRNLAAGTYYVLLSQGPNGKAIGDYRLNVRQPASATIIENPGETTHVFDAGAELGLFRFATTGGRIVFEAKGAGDTNATLYDGAGNKLAFDYTGAEDGRNFSISKVVSAGEYLLAVTSVPGVPFQLISSFLPGQVTRIDSEASSTNTVNTGVQLGITLNSRQGVTVTLPSDQESPCKIQSSADLNTWRDTGVVLDPKSGNRGADFALDGTIHYYRAVIQSPTE